MVTTAGTVLSEMQAKQHDSSTLIQLEFRPPLSLALHYVTDEIARENRTQKSLYNEDNANRSETGGMVDALRELKKKTGS